MAPSTDEQRTNRRTDNRAEQGLATSITELNAYLLLGGHAGYHQFTHGSYQPSEGGGWGSASQYLKDRQEERMKRAAAAAAAAEAEEAAAQLRAERKAKQSESGTGLNFNQLFAGIGGSGGGGEGGGGESGNEGGSGSGGGGADGGAGSNLFQDPGGVAGFGAASRLDAESQQAPPVGLEPQQQQQQPEAPQYPANDALAAASSGGLFLRGDQGSGAALS